MKRKFLILVVVFISVFNLSILIDNNKVINVKLDYLKFAKAQTEDGEVIYGGELPEVTITCGQFEGPCWDGYCHHEIGVFVLPMGYMICDEFTDKMSDSCLNEMPC